MHFWFRPPIVGVLLLTLAAFGRADDDRAGIEFFESNIRPVLVQHCYQCHAADAKKIKGGLLLDSRAGVLNGGEGGPVIVSGKADASSLIRAIKYEELEMPPQGKLPANVIADFVKWVNMGAPDPRDDDRPGVIQAKIDIDEGRNFWAFRPIQNPPAPHVEDTSWPRGDIDRFILAKLEERNIRPVDDADRLTLIRRVYFDLIGLPPSPQEVDEFLADTSDDALETVIDRLLDSPHFGERWGRHWLDVAHYAESNGNVRNFTFPHAWRYRDWVIDAVNRDLPYDQFITQQIAGDLLPATNSEQRNAQKIASGFLAMASKPQKGATLEMDLIAEQIEVTTRATMALTVACARCHDHKFDPIPTADYYAMAGIFTSSEMLYGGTGANGSAPKTDLHVLDTGDDKQAELAQQHEAKIAELKKRQQEIQKQLGAAGGKRKKKKKDEQQDTAENASTADTAQLRREAKQIANELKSLAGNAPQSDEVAMGARDRAATRDCPIYLKGESPKGDPVPRGFVQVATVGNAPEIADKHSGRLELAQWLTAPSHPLTARVMVNRIWHHLFGAGIVRTVDNFGINGERPSHPELLDHLATRFVSDGWSMKRMIRAIMLTRAYQLGSDHQERAFEADPDNQLVWRKQLRRLDGEAIRDSILAASGQLNRDPQEGSLVAQHGDKIIQDKFTVDVFRVPSNHRSVYLPIIRNGIPELLNVFDFANPSLVVGRRNVTTVPAQDLYMMNSQFVVEQSRAFARLLLDQPKMNDADRVNLAYRRALCRQPSEMEVERAAKLLETIRSANSPLAGKDAATNEACWATFCQALLVSAEFRYVN